MTAQPWVELFAQSGYHGQAPTWPGEPATAELAREEPDRVAGVGIDDIVTHDAGLIAAITKSTLKQYRHSDALTELLEMPDRGHSLTIDSGWREVASTCLRWLDEQDLQRESRPAASAVAGSTGANGA